jgi:hypothetical protein
VVLVVAVVITQGTFQLRLVLEQQAKVLLAEQ